MILSKPYTNEEYFNFAKIANKNGQRIEKIDGVLYALFPFEKIQNGEVINFISQTQYEANLLQEQINIASKNFLNDTDWKVIRHRDQVDSSIPTSLTQAEYENLLVERQAERDKVQEI